MDMSGDATGSSRDRTPKDWRSSRLCTIAEKIADGEHLTPRRTRQGYFLLSARNVLDGRVDLEDVDFVGPEEYSRIRRRCDPTEGDILISCSGSIGRVALVPPGLECVMVRSAAFVRLDAAVALSSFVQYYLQSAAGQLQIKNSLNQGAQANLFLGPIGMLQVPLPPLPEQKAIAAALSDVDALLGSLDRLIVKKRDIKQAAMQQLLTGQTRLPGYGAGDIRKNSEVRALPADWAALPLRALATMKSGEGITSASIDEFSPYPCYGGNGLRGYTTRYTHDGEYALIGRQGALCGNVLGVRGRFFASEHAVVVTAMSRTSIRWLTCVLGTLRLNRYSESSAQPGLSVAKVLGLVVATPSSREEQQAIAGVLSDMDAEILALEQRRDKTRLLKQGMMQELLTGRTRLI